MKRGKNKHKYVVRKLLQFAIENLNGKGYITKGQARWYLGTMRLRKKEADSLLMKLHKSGILRISNDRVYPTIRALTCFWLETIPVRAHYENTHKNRKQAHKILKAHTSP